MESKKVIIIDTDPAKKSLSELRKDVGLLREAISTMDKGTDEYNETLKNLNDHQNQISSVMNATKQTATALTGSYNALTFQMSQLKEQWKATNDETQRAKLGEQIKDINDKLKDMDAGIGNFQRNVGNYAGAFTDAFGAMGGSCNGLVGGINKVRKGFDLLKAHPIIAIIAIAVTVLMKIADAFKKNEESLNKVTLAFAPLKAVGTIFGNIMDKLSSMIANTIAKLGDLSKWIEKVGKKFAQFLRWMGMESFADNIEKGFQKLAEVSAEEERIIKREQALVKRKREVIVENAKLNNEANEAHAKAADKEHYTLEQRQKYLDIYAAKQKQIAANDLEIAKEELAIAKARAAQGANDAAANDALAQAEAKVYEQQAAYNNTLRSLNAERTKLRNEGIKAAKDEAKEEKDAAKEAKDAAKEAEAAVKKKIKALQDEYKMRETTIKDASNKEKQLLLEKLKNEEITYTEYQNGLKKIEVDANISRLEQATKFVEELKQIEDESITSTAEYATLLSTALGEITTATEADINAKRDQIDVQTEMIVSSLDVAQQSLSELASIGDGVSSKWADSIGRVSQLVTTISTNLKNGEKGWKAYGNVAASTLNVVGSLLGAFADEQDTTTKEGFEQAKKLQIGQATMSMLSGVIAAWTSAMALPAPASFILGAIETAATVALGAAQIASIAKQTFDSSSSASSSASPSSAAATTMVAPVQYTQDVQGASIEESIQNTKVYVTEGDIKDTSSKVDVAESEARY